MLRKGNEIKWIEDAKHYFEEVKEALTKAPMLINPDFSKDFIIFSFSSEHTIVGILMQKNDQNQE